MNKNISLEQWAQLRLCPVCKQPLLNEVKEGRFSVWCGHGPCASPNSNNGFEGNNLIEAYEKAHDEIIYPD